MKQQCANAEMAVLSLTFLVFYRKKLIRIALVWVNRLFLATYSSSVDFLPCPEIALSTQWQSIEVTAIMVQDY